MFYICFLPQITEAEIITILELENRGCESLSNFPTGVKLNGEDLNLGSLDCNSTLSIKHQMAPSSTLDMPLKFHLGENFLLILLFNPSLFFLFPMI